MCLPIIEELQQRLGDEVVTLSWLAEPEHLCDLHPA
jgi:hypothetical protein